MSIPPTGKKEKSIFLINYVLFIGIFYEENLLAKTAAGPSPPPVLALLFQSYQIVQGYMVKLRQFYSKV